MSHVAFHLSPITNTNSQSRSHNPSPSKKSLIQQKNKNCYKYANVSDMLFDQKSPVNQEAGFPSGPIQSNLQKCYKHLVRFFQNKWSREYIFSAWLIDQSILVKANICPSVTLTDWSDCPSELGQAGPRSVLTREVTKLLTAQFLTADFWFAELLATESLRSMSLSHCFTEWLNHGVTEWMSSEPLSSESLSSESLDNCLDFWLTEVMATESLSHWALSHWALSHWITELLSHWFTESQSHLFNVLLSH